MASITPDVDVGRFLDRYLGSPDPETLRQSERRRTLLENWARLVANRDLTLSLNDEPGETARIHMHGHPEIEVPSWEIPQPVTNYRREAYDMLMQRTMTLHEVGHLLYTDQAAVDTATEQVATGRREQFHGLWNALEDGAIEEQLRREFAVEEELRVTNANYMGSHGQRSKIYDALDATLRACLDLAVYDTGDLRRLLDESDNRLTFESDDLRETFEDEILPAVKDVAADIVGEPDPEARTERILTFWENIKEHFNPDAEPSEPDFDARGDHAQQASGPGESADRLEDIDSGDVQDRSRRVVEGDSGLTSRATDESTDTTTNEDSDEDHRDTTASAESEGDQAADATETQGERDPADTVAEPEGTIGADEASNQSPISDSDVEASGEQIPAETSSASSQSGSESPDHGSSETRTSQDENQQEGAEQGADGPSGQQSASSGDGGIMTEDIATDPPQDSALESEYMQHVSRQASALESDLEAFEEELEAFADVLSRLDDRNRSPRRMEVPVDRDESARSGAWTAAQRQGTRLRQILEQRLQEERRSEWRVGQPRGRVDPRSLTRLVRNDPRVFRQRTDPDEKDYSALLLLDRSGSMGSSVPGTSKDAIHYAEEATAAFAHALEELDIEVCVLDICRSRVNLAKPFGADVKQFTDQLLSGRTSGGTPLTEGLRVARERIDDEDGAPFAIVVTDGQPDDESAYMDELQQTTFPVLGIYLALSASSIERVPESVRASARLFDRRRIVTDETSLIPELRGLCREVMF